MREESDETLVQRAGAGDRLAASALVLRHTDRLMAICYRMLGERSAAEDAVQETFLRLWTNAHQWRPQGAKFSSWLIRVAMNQCLDRLRRSGREAPEDAAPERADDAPAADERMEADEQAVVVRAAVAGLPERQRQAIILSHYEEMSNIEIADIMETSVEAVESLLGRGRRQLRVQLAMMLAPPADERASLNAHRGLGS